MTQAVQNLGPRWAAPVPPVLENVLCSFISDLLSYVGVQDFMALGAVRKGKQSSRLGGYQYIF